MSENIFPFMDVPSDTVFQGKSIPKEYAWDFATDSLILKDGKPQVVEGLDAIRIWAYKALRTQRYRYAAYTWDYGHELEDLIGSGLSPEAQRSEIKRMIEDVLKINPYIKGINNLQIEQDGAKISVNFTVLTDYGEANISV